MKQLFLFWKSTIIIFGKEMEGITYLLESGTFTQYIYIIYNYVYLYITYILYIIYIYILYIYIIIWIVL